MCEELGNEKYMREYVMEYSTAPVYCDPFTFENCGSVEKKFATSRKKRSKAELEEEVVTLETKLADEKITGGLAATYKKNLRILKTLLEAPAAHDEL